MILRKVLKVFRFTNDERSRLTIGTGARLHPQLHTLLLKAGSNGAYPTGLDIQVATWLSVPRSVKRWLLFEAVSNTPSGTSLGYRLSLGSDPLVWSSGAWRAPAAHEWNTEAQINQGIQSLSVANTSIRVLINLKTTDATVTPSVSEVRLVYESDVQYQEDYVRSFLRLLRNVHPIADYRVTSTGGSTVNLSAIETPYNIVGADSAFDATTDQNLQVNLLSSYNAGTKVVTLSGDVTSGHVVHVRFTYEPEVTLLTSQDYTELDKVPTIILDNVATGQQHIVDKQCAIDKSTGSGFAWDGMYQCDLDVPLRIVTDKAVDQQRLADALKALFASNPFLVSLARDERYRLWLIDEYDQETFPSQQGLHSGRLRARIAKALFSPADAAPVYGVKRVLVTGGNLELSR